MQCDLKEEGLSRTVTITVPESEVQVAWQQALAKVAKQVGHVPGFRKGHVPKQVIESRYSDAIRGEAANAVISSTLPKALEDFEGKLVDEPSIQAEALMQRAPYEYSARFEVFPEIALSYPEALELMQSQEIADSDVEAAIAKAQKDQGQWQAVDQGGVEQGHRVTIAFHGTIDGEAKEGMSSDSHVLVMGDGQMIPGFEDGMLGMAVGDKRTLELKFPEDYFAQDLANELAIFEVEMKQIEVQQLATVDDEFAKKLGCEDGVDQLPAHLKEEMSQQLPSLNENIRKKQVLDALYQQNSFDLPSGLLQKEMRQMHQQTLQRMGLADNEAVANMPVPEDLYRDEANKRVSLGLIMRQIVADQSIEVAREEIRARVALLAKDHPRPEEAEEWFYSNKSALANVEHLLLEEKVIDWLLSEKVTITAMQAPFQTVVDAMNNR